MTAYEILSLANEYENALISTLMGYASIVSAFLVAAYLVADKLNRSMTILLLALYGVFAFQISAHGITKMLDLANVAHVAAQMAQDPNLNSVALYMLNSGAVNVYPYGVFVYAFIYVVSFAGSIAFFFTMRRQITK